MEWLDARSHPKLWLEGESIEVAYQPVDLDHGPDPLLATFKVQCIVRHYTGCFIYTADDVTMKPLAFGECARNLRQVLDGDAQKASLASVGPELVVVFNILNNNIVIDINIAEWQGPYDSDTCLKASSICFSESRLYQWADDLKIYSEEIESWIYSKRTNRRNDYLVRVTDV